MQQKVIKQLSNIESLMISKLHNTQQKLKLLGNSDKIDVVTFMQRESSSKQKRHRLSSGTRIRNGRLRNVRSIQLSGRLQQPDMQFVDRLNTSVEPWGKTPFDSFYDIGKRSKVNVAYVSQQNSRESRSRSRSQSANK